MDLRDKFLKSLHRQAEDYIPFEFDLCPSKLKEFEQKFGTDDYISYCNFPFRAVCVEHVRDKKIFLPYHESVENTELDDWGVGYKAGSLEHFTQMQHPMWNFETLADFEKYPYPDPERDNNWEGLTDTVKKIKEQKLAVVASMQITIFEIAWYLRGMENFMMDMLDKPELVTYHLDRITAVRCEFARRYAKSGTDVLFLGDDIATQIDLMMSPAVWHKFIQPRLERVIESAKTEKPDILIAYHSDGNVQKLIPDLIETGVEILNPIQPECMDPVDIKRLYGNRLSFWGTVGTQTTMPFGSTDQVRQCCRRMIREVGKGGGLVLAPTHTIEPEVPWENIHAFLDVVKEYNGI